MRFGRGFDLVHRSGVAFESQRWYGKWLVGPGWLGLGWVAFKAGYKWIISLKERGRLLYVKRGHSVADYSDTDIK